MESPNKRWAESWLGGYWALTGLILILGPGFSVVSVKQGLLQFLAALLLFMLSSWVDRHPRWMALFWIAWIPCLLFTYKSLDLVQKTLQLPTHDRLVLSWERALWGDFALYIEWSKLWPWLVFSEFLHLCYITYYLMVPIMVVRLLRWERQDLARLAVCGAISTLVVCYLISVVFPVLGPRPLTPPLALELRGPVWRLCHLMVKGGAAAAAAFPSGHTAFSVAAALMAWRWDRRWRWVYAIWAAGVVAATVYGRFHYTVDVFAGALIGLICAGAVIYSDPDTP